jgi:hypothetical protein
MGDALISCSLLKCYSGLPGRASAASKERHRPRKNNKPLDVAMVPPEARAAPVCGYVPAIEFVSRLKAIRTFCEVSLGMRFSPVE